MKKFLLSLLSFILVLTMLVSCAGEPGIQGEKGDKGDPGADGKDGASLKIESCERTATEGLVDTYTITFTDGTYINLQVTNGAQGAPGARGETLSVLTCEKTGSVDYIDTYTISFSDGSIASFQVCNAYELITIDDIGYDSDVDEYTLFYSDGTMFSFSLPEDAQVYAAYENTAAAGFSTPYDWAINVIGIASNALLSNGGSALNPKAFGCAVPTLLTDFDEYFTVESNAGVSTKVTVTETKGSMSTNGTVTENTANQNYVYTHKIDVKTGQLVKLAYGSRAISFRYVTAFYNEGVRPSFGIDGTGAAVSTYTVPDGVDQIVLTYAKQGVTLPTVTLISYETTATLKLNVTASTINTIVAAKNSSAGGNTTVVTTLTEESIYASAETLAKGQYLSLGENHVMNDKTLTLTFDVGSLSASDIIRLGHGETSYGGSYIELTSSELRFYNYNTSLALQKSASHGLNISGYVNITINMGMTNADISVTSSSGTYRMDNVNWSGRQGEIFAVSTASPINNVKMRWTCTALTSDFWLFGDSYFNTTYGGRWPYYMVQDGITDVLLTGYPGRACAAALEEFETLLEHGAPKYAVWCMGMNNRDSDTAINATYLATTQEFIRLCEENGITPILTTIPCTPTVNNSYKNAWVKASGYRYVDFARAVGGEAVGSSWYAGMLHSDNVHPDTLGAEALYYQFIADLPEIFGRS